MKKPYLNQFERQLITVGTLTGDFINLRFRLKQLEKAILKCIFDLKNYGRTSNQRT